MSHPDPKSVPESQGLSASKPARKGDGRSTRDRLLRAAERLVARAGVDGVSTREILVAAGADSAAIHYHFGSKDELMCAVFERRINVLADAVDRFLKQRKSAGRALTTRDLAEAIVLPVAELAADREGGGCHYLGFLVALRNYRPLARLMIEDTRRTTQLLAVYGEVAPDLDPAQRRRNLGFAIYVTTGALGDGSIEDWLAHTLPKSSHDIVDDLIGFLAEGLAPARRGG
jgi:AcrR family transcriptional regulator